MSGGWPCAGARGGVACTDPPGGWRRAEPQHDGGMTVAMDTGAERWKLSLIQTKMSPPRPPRGRVHRRALLKSVGTGIDRSLTLVIAPAGFGKTTFLAEWCELLRSRRHVVGWLSLDGEDDDVQQFGAYVLASLCREENGVGRRAEELLRNDPLTPVRTVMSVLLNEIAGCGRQVFLVLDDFDRLKSKQVRATVTRLMRYAPPNFHLLVGVRSETGLELASFQTQDQLLRIDASGLRFSADDAQLFFQQSGGTALDRASVDLLHGATEGWVAGLQLAALALRETGDAAATVRDLAGNRFGVGNYFEEAVLAHLSPAILQFMLRTSILDRLSPSLCDAVMGGDARSWEKLDWLEQHNVFIRALDDERRWFRFHALMSDALRRRADRQLLAQLPELHRRASQWFASEQLWPEAVRHALSGGAMQQAASFVENCAMTLLDRSDVHTLLGWIARLPPELVNQRLRLRLVKAWALALSLNTGEATRAVETLMVDLAAGHTDAGPLPATDLQTSLPAEVNAVSAIIAALADDSPRALALGRAAAESASSAPPWVRRFAETAQLFGLAHGCQFDEVRRMQSLLPGSSGDTLIFADVYRTCMFGLSALNEGLLPEATQIYASALARAEETVGRESVAAALPAGPLAALLYERNDLAAVRRLLVGRTVIAMEACPLGSLLFHCQAAANLHARGGDNGSAMMILEEARQLATARQWLRVRAGCDTDLVRLNLRLNRLAKARDIAAELDALMPAQLPSPMGSFLQTWASYRTVKARLAIAEGRLEEAVALLEGVCERLDAAGMRYLEAGASLLLAVALEKSGAGDAALSTLDRALRYAQPNQMVNSFVDEGEPVQVLVQAWQRSDWSMAPGIGHGFATQLLDAFAGAAAPQSGSTSALAGAASNLLSAREIEVIQHISRGLSNKEVARALKVAPETIKWHLKNIFEKLGVGTRTEAVHIGLGLANGPV